MTNSLMIDAFGHHVWATLQLVDTCAVLDDDQLATSVDGTFGSILETFRHLVGADSGYLFALTGGRFERDQVDEMDLSQLRSAMAAHLDAWNAILASDPDVNEMVVRKYEDGFETHATYGIRLAQAVHHGTDHRSQICTALQFFNVGAPPIDVWDFGATSGRMIDVASSPDN